MYLDGETVHLIPLPAAHTDGDTAVKFDQADVLMTGDVFRSQGFPAAAVTNGGSFLGTIEALNELSPWPGPNTKVVPGHGPVVDKAALVFHRDMAVTVRDRVAKALREGKSADEIRAIEADSGVRGEGRRAAERSSRSSSMGLITELSAQKR